MVIAGVCGQGGGTDHDRAGLAPGHSIRGAPRARAGYGAPVSATFIFLMVVLKAPIAALLYIVWWAIHAEPEPAGATDEDGGSTRPRDPSPRPRHPHPRPALPRPSRRDPHGAAPVPAPPRVRTVVARARRVRS